MVGMRDDDDLLGSRGSSFFHLDFDVDTCVFLGADMSGVRAGVDGWRDA